MTEVDREALVDEEEENKSDKPKKPSTVAVVLIVIFTILIIALGVAFIIHAKKICDEHAKTLIQSEPQVPNKPDNKSY